MQKLTSDKVKVCHNSERQTPETFRESLQKIKVNFCTYKSSPGVAKKFETTQRDNTQTQKVEHSLILLNIQRERKFFAKSINILS